MTDNTFKSPEHLLRSFNCPNCGVYAEQRWNGLAKYKGGLYTIHCQEIEHLSMAHCCHCGQYSLWKEKEMIFPFGGTAPLPNSDLPDDIKNDYEEARMIVLKSPRGAATLLRLCIQKICILLGEKGKDINTDIGNLVKKGLPDKIQKSLDIVRVIGNEVVHPGSIDLKDDIETADKLFLLVNMIAEDRISNPKNVNDLYDSLPESKKRAITNRDKK